jgi:hypothetical protein
MFSGCDKDDPDKTSEISVSDEKSLTQEVSADNERGSSVGFTTKGAWTSSVSTSLKATDDASDWVSILPEHGAAAGNYSIEISLAPNMTGADRMAVITITCGDDKMVIRVTQKSIAENPIELHSPITHNLTLNDLGLPVDYIYNNGNTFLSVENNAVLTIGQSVTIQFATPYEDRAGLIVADGATIKANGTSSKPIQFIGATNTKGSWKGIIVETMTDNQFSYCDFVNAGWDLVWSAALYLFHAKAGITHCKFTNGSGYGLYVHNYESDCQLTAFNNNVFEDFDLPPVYIYASNIKQLEKFDMTSDFTKNKMPYIELDNREMDGNVTINQTTVPYFFTNIFNISHTLTINEGVTIYMPQYIGFTGDPFTDDSRLMINGTAAKKVKITRLPGDTDNWDGINGQWLPGSVIKHCILEYGGEFDHRGVIFAPNGTDITLDNVEFKNTKTYDGVIPFSNNYVIRHSNITYSRPSGNVWDGHRAPNIIDAFP